MDLADRDGGSDSVLAECTATHEVKQCLSTAREATCAIWHQTLTLGHSAHKQISHRKVSKVAFLQN